jgi:hypothetical protein
LFSDRCGGVFFCGPAAVMVVAGCSWAETNFFSSTVLTREPELGRKLLDLHKLYNTVTKLGGYDKVTEQKGELRRSIGWSQRNKSCADRANANSGAWRDIANSYKPPINNSNAGYLLKTIYYKNLALVHHSVS